ncbi:MAG: uroporphyrinogen-III C-methyltransferase [Deltaproteobacteria bacterium]|nr:uroporphyrinogen-III C-methyltransferase [Deltaproteobacteria bacterium]
MARTRGVVFLVGGGPGDPGLVTRRGAECLASADCVIYDGLVSAAVLALANPEAERIYAGKKRSVAAGPLTQDAINQLLIERAGRGLRVVRLKGGDPFVFGRGAEEVKVLADANVPFEVVPGVSAATAVPAYAGIPLTSRGMTSTVALVTGHEAPGKLASDIDWDGVAKSGTVVLFMALANIELCVNELISAGRDPRTPSAVIHWGTTSEQRTVEAALEDLPEASRASALKPPALIVIGDVVGMRSSVCWFENRPLFGRRVLITREGRRARELARQISQLGGEPLTMPVTRVEPCGAPAKLESAIARLSNGGFDWLVFASANAVECFWAKLWERGGDARTLAGVRIAAVGAKTAAAAAAVGLRADLVPERGNAEGLAAEISAAGGERVLVPRSATGRPELVEGLTAAGAEVEALDVYRTAVVPADDPTIADGLRLLRAHKVDVVLVFAPSQVEALEQLLGRDFAGLLARTAVATIGSTTARALRERGLEPVVVASKPDAQVLLAEVAGALSSS